MINKAKSILTKNRLKESLVFQKRSILLSNYISWILVIINVLLLILIPGNHNLEAIIESAIAIAIFAFPFLLNHLKLYTLSNFYLSWVPPILVTLFFMYSIEGQENVSPTVYDGLKFYIIASGSIPVILFGRNQLALTVFGILPSLIVILFFESIFSFFELGFGQIGVEDGYYHINRIRSFIAYFIITASSFSLRFLVDKSDLENFHLQEKLAHKNKEIQEQSDRNLAQLNTELSEKVKQLEHREFMLSQSQKVANIGNWECDSNGKFTFWSKEMYNIFGFDDSTEVTQIKLSDFLKVNEKNKFEDTVELVLEAEFETKITLPITTPIGYHKWVEFFFYVIKNDRQQAIIRGVCKDITYFKESEQLLKSNERKYKGLFKQSFYPIILINKEGLVLDANESFDNLIEAERNEFIYHDINTLLRFDLNKAIKTSFEIDNFKMEGEISTILGNILQIELFIGYLDHDNLILTFRDITELKLAEQRIIESELKFRTSFEFSANGMALLSKEGYFMEVNEKLCEITGYSANELKEVSFSDITYKDDLPRDADYTNMLERGEASSYNKEKRYIHKSGAIIWVSISTSIIKNPENEEDFYYVAQIQDVTDRKNSESQLIEAEERFRTLVERSLVGVYIIQDDRFEYVNPAFYKLFGYTESEMLSLNDFSDLVHEDDQQKIKANVAARMNGELLKARTEIKGVDKQGKIIWVEAYGSNITYKGRPAVIGTLVDITDRKQFEKEQALLGSIVESIDEAIISISIDGFINSWNTGAQKIFDLKPWEAINHQLNEIIPSEILPNDEDLALVMNDDLLIENLEKKWLKKGGWRNISISFFPLKDRSNNLIGSTIVARDITNRIKAQQELKESEERYRDLVENASEALVVFKAKDGDFVHISNSAIELFKTSHDQLLDMSISDLSPKYQPDGKESRTQLRMYILKATKYNMIAFDWTFLDLEGNQIPTEVRLTKVPSKEGLFVRGSIIDISERIEKNKLLAEANKKIGELKLMALRSVMSPHFIFNVLNSIQFFIGKNDRLNAINYLSTFSKLIRGILTHSVDNKIKLSEEIEMLKNYVELEMLRFDNKFDFELIVDEDLDLDYIEVPSLLIQPYVENAILHGLYNKEGKGKLTLEVTEKGDVIYFKILDNGIGREAAKKLRKKSFPKHKSMGLKLTEERLKLINENHNISFYIQDVMENNEVAGTVVTIGILT